MKNNDNPKDLSLTDLFSEEKEIYTKSEYLSLQKQYDELFRKFSDTENRLYALAAENRELCTVIRERGTEELEDEIAALNKEIHELKNEKLRAEKEIIQLQRKVENLTEKNGDVSH